VAVKSEPIQKTATVTHASHITGNAKAPQLNGNTVRASDLPDFAKAEWKEKFLPTLYDRFYILDKPFDGFQKGSNLFIALVQQIVEDMYENVDYKVTGTESIHLLVGTFN